MNRLLIIFSLAILLLNAYTPVVLANNFVVSPLIVDVDAKQRDSFVKTVTIRNEHTAPQRYYASVHEIAVDGNGELKEFVPASMSDRSVSVTSWIEISRARIDLQPGESKELPLTIRVNQAAPAGLYHAFVGFAQASNADQAAAKVQSGLGEGVLVRIGIEALIDEGLKLNSFTTDKFSIINGRGSIKYVLENTGDTPLVPAGDIIIYDLRGRELTALPVNATNPVTIAPGEKKEFITNLPYFNRLGKHKVYLHVEYGEQNQESVYDTNFYYSVPWYYLTIIVLLLLTLVFSLSMLARRRNYDLYDPYEVENGEDVPLQVGRKRTHVDYEHDINLKQTKE
jgi:hypothetical protein